ncbi:MAG TPA: GNAT family N-acetyltransferase [Caulobacteraceae bacterium]|jgi:ribosomal protein S18 acetylase RimI-like enzyme
MTALSRPAVAVVTPESLALLDRHLGNSGIPDMHQQRFKVQMDGAGLYLAAWRDDAPVGYVLLHFKHPPHHASYEHYPACAYVEALDVREASRRQGFAVALMDAAEAQALARGAAFVGLSVGVDNTPARGLYRKLGYQPTELPDYWVSWTYLDRDTGEPMEEGETCSFWIKRLTK